MIIEINDIEIDLPENVTINYVQSSTVFNPLQGSYSYPITIKKTAKNNAALNYPTIPSIAANIRQDNTARIWLGNFLLGEGTAKIQSATENTITLNIEVMPGGTKKSWWKNTINKLDIGSETIPEITITSQYNLKILWQDINLNDLTDYTFGHGLLIYFDSSSSPYIGTPVFNYQFSGDMGVDMPIYRKLYIDRINNLKPEHIIITADEQGITIQTTSPNTRTTIQFGHSGGIYRSFDMTHVSRTTINQTYYNNKLDNTIYALPEIANYKFYATQDDWQGIINLRNEDGTIQLNQDGFKNRNTIIPQLKLKWVLQQLFSLLGYELSGTFLADSDIQKLLILSLFATDKQAETTTLPFNVHSSVITYANHLPGITLADFLQSLIDEFAIGIEFNSLTKKAELFFVNEVFDSSEILDLSDRISFAHSSDLQELKKKQIKWATGSDELVTDTEPLFLPSPLDSEILEVQDQYTSQELKFPTLVKMSGLLEIETPGISPMYAQSKNEAPKRFIFLVDGKAENKTDTLSLSLTGANNLIDKFHTQKLELENNYLPLKAKALFTLQELVSFSFKTKILAYNVLFLCEEISAKLTRDSTTYEVEMKLRRL